MTVEGTYVDFAGNPKVGKVSFSRSGTVVDPAAKVIITAGTVEAELKNGKFSIQLPATDDPDISPNGEMYTVTEQLQNGGGRPPFKLSLPSSLTQPVDLTTVDLGQPSGTPITNYVTLEALNAEAGFRASGDQAILNSKGQPNGIVPLGADQKIAVLYLPDQSGTYVPVVQKGAANGVATLDANGRIPAAQYDAAVVVLISTKGAANGVASLDASAQIPQAQIPTARVGASAAVLFGAQVTGDTQQRFQINSAGTLLFGSGSAAPDVQLLRVSSSMLRTMGGMESQQVGAGQVAFAANLVNEGFDRFRIYPTGTMEWGPGNAARDVNLYRGGADLLKTQDNFEAANFPSGAWTDWTPTWTTSGTTVPSYGNATIKCRYTQIGKTVFANVSIIFGSTTNFGTAGNVDNWRFSLPVPAAAITDAAGVI
ncbi:hypothetical protein ACFV42_49125, partial [Streptomyces solisilvae]